MLTARGKVIASQLAFTESAIAVFLHLSNSQVRFRTGSLRSDLLCSPPDNLSLIRRQSFRESDSQGVPPENPSATLSDEQSIKLRCASSGICERDTVFSIKILRCSRRIFSYYHLRIPISTRGKQRTNDDVKRL